MDVATAGGNFADRLHELGVGCFLQQVAVRAGAKRLADIGRVVLHREHEHFRVGSGCGDLGQCFDPVSPRHDNVEEEDVRLSDPYLLDCLVGVRGLSNHSQVRFGLEKTSQARTDERVVVAELNVD